jgi:hypothetical protein
MRPDVRGVRKRRRRGTLGLRLAFRKPMIAGSIHPATSLPYGVCMQVSANAMTLALNRFRSSETLELISDM